MTNNLKTRKMVLSALFLALAYVMPFLTGQIPEIGAMLCPMHVPVILCGYICGWQWGFVVGAVAPIFRSLTLGMPYLFPTAVCMAVELAVYGAVSGLLYRAFPRKRIYLYCSLLIAMIAGRLIWGIAMFACTVIGGGTFGLSAFLAGAVTGAIPGIAVQIILIPIIMMILENSSFIKNTI